jgi:antitoxin ParD1/3/4
VAQDSSTWIENCQFPWYLSAMTIALTQDQIQWLEAEVAAGTYASVEDAVRLAVAGLMAAPEVDGLAWAKPLIDDARASIAKGDGVSANNVRAEMDALLRSLGAR